MALSRVIKRQHSGYEKIVSILGCDVVWQPALDYAWMASYGADWSTLNSEVVADDHAAQVEVPCVYDSDIKELVLL